ncbi:putative F-box protein PP2-B12 [Mangifera indica]|uniref:putative F-box protein PP2-B12 n=1 Tax=Mangifera indica TaxID=29780 RepID=UPI001CFB0F14|nr:putative F-box protein PP2-B12 [Mangifera indica]
MKIDMSAVLPEECISKIISFTSARDACRFSVVSSLFKSAADSDAVWEKFLPSDYQEIISSSVSPSLLTTNLSKKDLYLHLCRNPITINNGTMSFAIEKNSGKKCFMVGARELSISWGNDSRFWAWLSLPESRFGEVAYFRYVWCFDVKGKIDTKILSPKTTYGAYLVFNLHEYGFRKKPVESGVYLEKLDNGERRSLLLDPPPSVNRGDGWKEIEMGEFFNENGDDGTLICSLSDFSSRHIKQGLFIEGIELRPKNS